MTQPEVEHLFGPLERQRATFRWKPDGLDDIGLAVRVGASAMTPAACCCSPAACKPPGTPTL